MGLRIFVGQESGYAGALDSKAVLLCSTTGIVFGRMFYSVAGLDADHVAQAFLNWCEEEKHIKGGDVRAITSNETIALQDEFLKLPAHELEEWAKETA